MKIMVAGDVHGDFAKLNRLIARQQPSILLQCGDFGFWPKDERFDLQTKLKPGSTRIHFIDGNHEDHLALDDVQQKGNLEVMENCFFSSHGAPRWSFRMGVWCFSPEAGYRLITRSASPGMIGFRIMNS